MQRLDIVIPVEGASLHGWLYLPKSQQQASRHPVVVMAHGFSAVKEQGLDLYAEVFAASGLAVLVFDNRNFGASEGAPRQEIDPIQQIRDYRHAITYVTSRPELDSGRIGVWGTSFSGGHALVLGALDRRVKCIVSQVPTISGFIASSRRVRADMVTALLARFDADRLARFHGAAPGLMPIVSQDAAAPCALPGEEAFQFFTGFGEAAPNWRNEVTLRSAEMAREYEPGIYISRISPTPLLMIVAMQDTVTPTDLALEAYNRALEPKHLIMLSGGHFAPYHGPGFEISSIAARDWLQRHLIP